MRMIKSRPRLLKLIALSALCWGCEPEPHVSSSEGADHPTAGEAPAGKQAATGGSLVQGPALNDCRDPDTQGATARCLQATLPAEHYEREALKYFDTLDIDAPEDSVPEYAPLVARWEWPPWLLLTGYGAEDMISTGLALREVDPSRVPERDCRFFEEQPFARCYVVFEYHKGPCPIYEEFTFNAQGQTTFIEAWSDLPGLRPEGLEGDPWGEGADFPRLSTRVPGLGTQSGRVTLESEWMERAAASDPALQDYRERASDWRAAWLRALREADPQFFSIGCGWDHE